MSQPFARNDPACPRGTEKRCQLCLKEFGVFRKEHQCKRCLRAVCFECGEDKIMTYKLGLARRPHRSCKPCKQEVQETAEYIETNRLAFAKTSPIAAKWLKKIDAQPRPHAHTRTRLKNLTKEQFSRMWDSYNYSLREFVGMLTFELQQEDVYRVVGDAYAAVGGACPDVDLESTCYLIVFLLCFCAAEKVPALCLALMELKSAVTDEEGLVSAYLRSLGVGEQTSFKMKDYMVRRTSQFSSAFSVNLTNVKSSIYIIDRVISRRKIDELYLFLGLSLELVKETIVKNRNNWEVIDLAMVRNPVDAVTAKYKQTANVKTSLFIREREKNETNNSFQTEHHNNNNNSAFGNTANSFSEGLREHTKRENNQREELYKTEQRSIGEELRLNEEVKPFRKKAGEREQEFTEDSFSMYSMIEEIKQPPKRTVYERSETQLLNLLTQTEKSPNISIDKQERNAIEENISFSLEEKNSNEKECEQCSQHRAKINEITNQLKEAQNIIRELREKQGGLREREKWDNEKIDYEAQIKRLKQAVMDLQTRDKEAELTALKMQDSKRTIKKQQTEIRFYQQQIEQLNLTSKMLKNKLQSQATYAPPPKENTNQSSRVLEMLKQSVREKNQQIEDITKRNKLLAYQLEEAAKAKMGETQKLALEDRCKRAEKERSEVMSKMQELSMLLMQEQGEKLNLSEENFALRQLLKSKGIKFDHLSF